MLIKDLPIQTTLQSQLHQQRINDCTPFNEKKFKEVTDTFEQHNKIIPTKKIVVIAEKNINKSEQHNDVHSILSRFNNYDQKNVIHLDITRRLDNTITNEKHILSSEMSNAPLTEKRRRIEPKRVGPISSKATSNSNPMADLFSSISTPITSAYTSKFFQAQYKSIEAVETKKET